MRGSMAGLGMGRRVRRPLWAGTWRCCSGHGSKDVRGVMPLGTIRVHTPPAAGTWRCCSGRGSAAVLGMGIPVPTLLQAGAWRY